MNFMKYPRAFLVDLDGTVINTEKIYMSIMMNYNKSYGIYISRNFYLRNFLGKTKSEISNTMKILFNDKYEDVKYWDGLLSYRKEYLAKSNIECKNGFDDFVKYAKSNNIILVLVTSNSKIFVDYLLKLSKLDKNTFDLIVCRDQVKMSKPSPDLYNYAIKKIGIKRKYIFAIEDSEVGIESALNAKLKTINIKDIAIVKESTLKKCYKTISSFEEIIDFLENCEDDYGNN